MTASTSSREPLSESRIAPYNLDEADDLRRSFITALIGLVCVLAWITAVRASSCSARDLASCGWMTPLSLGLSALITYGLRERPRKLVAAILMVCLIISTEMEWVFTTTRAAPYFFALIVIAASMLFSARGALITIGLTLIALCGGAAINGIDLVDVSGPITFLVFCSVVAWLGTRQFLTALTWASFSSRQAQAAAADAQQHRAELALRSHDLDQAYARMERMNQMLVLARQYAESARVQKSQFANAVSHELRSPINMIIGFTEMMVNAREVYVGQQWTPRLSHHLAQVYKSGQHLSQLIDDVLDLARIDSYRMALNKQPVAIAAVIGEAIEITRELFAARGLFLRADIGHEIPDAPLDQIRIRQVLLNLITNAIRFTQSGGVTVRAFMRGDEVIVEVEDTGVGIAPAELAGLFQEFHQADNNLYRQGRGSSGLGLVISKRLVEQHGGRIWAESMPAAGSRFAFSLPVHPGGSGESGLQRAVHEDGWWPALEREARKRMRLLVKADESTRRLITASLAQFDLIWVDEKSDVAQQVADQYPLALVCAGTPASGGRLPDAALLTQLGNLPVIVCSLAGRVTEVLPAPFSDALVKPVSRDQLQQAVTKLDCNIRRILLVDDDAGMSEYLAAALGSINPAWVTHSVPDAATALAVITTFEPDLVLLDIGLPDMDGRELASRLHALHDARIVAVTAEDLASAMTRAEPDSVTYWRSNRFSQVELETLFKSLASAMVPATEHIP